MQSLEALQLVGQLALAPSQRKLLQAVPFARTPPWPPEQGLHPPEQAASQQTEPTQKPEAQLAAAPQGWPTGLRATVSGLAVLGSAAVRIRAQYTPGCASVGIVAVTAVALQLVVRAKNMSSLS